MSDSDLFCTGAAVMQAGFQTTMTSGRCILFLFSGFVLDEPWKYVLGLFLSFSMGVTNEVLLFLRRWVSVKIEDKGKPWRILLCLIYGVHMILAYWMMLLVMTYETLIFFSIIFGLMVGNLVFQLVPVAIELKLSDANGSTPCCGGNNLK